ncbi:hypothetical protein C5O78_05575 [Treponema phagedenis]|nr:hypothetical protein C5O78_05575 [Treponema phagedenis]
MPDIRERCIHPEISFSRTICKALKLVVLLIKQDSIGPGWQPFIFAETRIILLTHLLQAILKQNYL